MTDPNPVTRSASSFSSFEFSDEEGLLSITGMLTVHDDSNQSVLYLVDANSGAKLLRLMPTEVDALAGILSAVSSTLNEITLSDEDLRSVQRGQ